MDLDGRRPDLASRTSPSCKEVHPRLAQPSGILIEWMQTLFGRDSINEIISLSASAVPSSTIHLPVSAASKAKLLSV